MFHYCRGESENTTERQHAPLCVLSLHEKARHMRRRISARGSIGRGTFCAPRALSFAARVGGGNGAYGAERRAGRFRKRGSRKLTPSLPALIPLSPQIPPHP